MSSSGYQPGSYFQLVRTNQAFRRLWFGDIASNLGDWFNTIAIYTLIEQLTGSPLALGLVFVTKSLPFALTSPIAGLIADRLPRRSLMIAADLIRALVVLGLVMIREPEQVAWIYVLGALQMVAGAFFIPARSASIPNVTSADELLTANALSASTWSTLLALGAALGGLATAWLGPHAVFVLDSVSYLVSAFFVWRTAIPQNTDPVERGHGSLVATAVAQVLDGWKRMIDRPDIGRIALTKSAWAVGGGGLVYMLALLGQNLMPQEPAMGIGWLYTARGLGTGVGPIVMRSLLPDRRRWPAMIGWGIAFSGLAYIVVTQVSALWLVLVLVVLGHSTSGANWVASTVLLQERTEDRFRGRVFASEWLVLTLVDTISIVFASLLLETGTLTLRGGILLFAGVQCAVGAFWLLRVAPAESR